MVRYFVIFIIIVSGVIFATNYKHRNYEKRRKNYIRFVIIILILQSGLRNLGVGSDTYGYYLGFKEIEQYSWASLFATFTNYEGKDPFYFLFQKFFQIFSHDFQLYLFFVAIIFMAALGNFILKNTTRISHAIIAFIIYMGYYYGFFSITGLRQTIATAFLLWSFEYVKQQKLFIFTLLVLFASLFHSTALVFFPLYFIAQLKRPGLIFGLALLGFPLAMIFKNELAVFYVDVIGVEKRFGVYTEQYYRGGSVVVTAFYIVLSVWALILRKKVLAFAPTTYRIYNTFALALFFFPLMWVNPSAGRISQYFSVFMMVWIPYLLDSMAIRAPKKRQIIYFIAVITFVVITSFVINAETEYKFFWQEMKLPEGY